MQSKYFFGFIMSFIAGVGLESLFNFGYSLGVLFLFVGVVTLLLRGVRSVKGTSFLVSLMAIACGLGVIRIDMSVMKHTPHSLDMFLQNTVTIEGRIFEEPDVREKYTNIVLNPERVFYGSEAIPADSSERILVRVPSYPEFHYGDSVSVVGALATPKNFSSPDTKQTFDYKTYLAKDNVFYQMYFPTVNIVTQGDGNIVLRTLFAVKEKLLGNIVRAIPEPEAALGGGVLLGAKQSLGDDLLQKFRETGVAHIVVLSGYNIAIVATALSRSLYFLPFMVRLGASVFGVVLFAILVGGGATVIRATLMVLVVIIARAVGRESDALRGLVLAGGLMVLVNPLILFHDVSFQLSFMATLALVVVVPLIEQYFTFVHGRVVRDIVVTTIATQIFVLPLILYYMGSISLIGLVANIFILPVVPIAMAAVAFVAVLGFIPVLGNLFAGLAYSILWYMIFAVEAFSRLPFAQISGVAFPLWLLVVTYVVMGGVLMKNYFSSPRTTSSLLM